MLGCWYCSYICFAPIATDCLQHLTAAPPVSSSHTSRLSLPLILLNRKCLTRVQSSIAAVEQGVTNAEIGDTLIRLGFCNEEEVITARSIQWGCPVFSTPPEPLLELSAHVPISLQRTFSMIPLHYVPSTSTLLVGFVKTVEYGILYAIEQMTGVHTKACLVTRSVFEELSQQHAFFSLSDELTFEIMPVPSQMARIICDYGALLGAYELAIRRCREHIWARMRVPSGTSDILFKIA
jgi:hypothetical protein